MSNETTNQTADTENGVTHSVIQAPCLDVFKSKYAASDEEHPFDAFDRVAKALAALETKDIDAWTHRFRIAMTQGGAIPAGRILANLGHPDRSGSTINCTVSTVIEDSIEGIGQASSEAMRTLAQGCGIGYCFSTLRPKGAHVSGVGASTGGPLPFMSIFDTLCSTISSAGGRRGAQMGTMDCRHPDIEAFIAAKREPGKYTQFNLSVLCTDRFMMAVEKDDDWDLIFPVRKDAYDPNARLVRATWPKPGVDDLYDIDADGRYLCEVHKTIKARSLWDQIMQSTYNHAEPGVLFVDRINLNNPLYWTEDIQATNPCGEQPLPPHGACLLGSIDLTKHVQMPLMQDADFNFKSFADTVQVFSRMLDNVADDPRLPLPAQNREIEQKRRHGMGITGLGSTLNLLGIRYGSEEAARFVEKVGRYLARASWHAAVDLAAEKGPAPIYADIQNVQKTLKSRYFKKLFAEGVLDHAWREKAIQHGLRYTHATSIAPTGTISLISDNVSNGIEPTFCHQTERHVAGASGEAKTTITLLSHEERLRQELGVTPDHWVEADDISPKEHLMMQASMQTWVDSAISKTVNVPENIPYDDFQDVYRMAFNFGLKGCTTYRPTPQRAGVLNRAGEMAERTYLLTTDAGVLRAAGNALVSHDRRTPVWASVLHEAWLNGQYDPDPAPDNADWPTDAQHLCGRIENIEVLEKGDSQKDAETIDADKDEAWSRPVALTSQTWKIRVPRPESESIYLHLGHSEGKLREAFISGKSSRCAPWQNAFTLALSALMRETDNISELIQDLKDVRDADGGAFGLSVDGNRRYLPSIVSEIGHALEQAVAQHGSGAISDAAPLIKIQAPTVTETSAQGRACRKCGAFAVQQAGGCETCTACGDSRCG